MRYHSHNAKQPLFVSGRQVLPGTFYTGEVSVPLDKSFGEATASLAPKGGDGLRVTIPENQNDDKTVPSGTVQFVIPQYDDVTIEKMKTQLDEWDVDYSGHLKDKTTLYNYFVEEAMNRYGNPE